ncbi:MAG: UDP-N-acetylmuramate--L-alanine ligase [Deferribacterales bacterium]|nr:UDP-N-acetylmuramate--L-alanine ligase [Deferribacterales bacterium]
MNRVFGGFTHIHFVGIGGIGMSGIAEVLKNMGFVVSGSDIASNSNTQRLKSMGVNVYTGHRAENIRNVDVIVYTSAAAKDNPEIVAARENHIPVISRGEMLAELMRLKYAVAVAGSHGKTTTTSMMAEIVQAAKLDPTILIGGKLNSTHNNAALGKSNIMVAEADESDRSFLMLYPSIAIITNIDHEHMENYKDFDDVKSSFAKFANRVPFYGCCVVCIDNDNVADIIPQIEKRMITYGTKAQADIRAVNIVKDGFGVSFEVLRDDTLLGSISLKLPGEHVVLNALAATAAALEMSIPFSVISGALSGFGGVERRMSRRYDNNGIIVLDDYGHHPTEIATTLKAVREAMPGRKISVIFQPHRYSRTQNLMGEFAKCFMDADKLFITDIYAASEQPIEGIDSEVLIREIKNYGFRDITYLPKWHDFFDYIDESDGEESVIITFGAGSITNFSYEIADYLKGKEK